MGGVWKLAVLPCLSLGFLFFLQASGGDPYITGILSEEVNLFSQLGEPEVAVKGVAGEAFITLLSEEAAAQHETYPPGGYRPK